MENERKKIEATIKEIEQKETRATPTERRKIEAERWELERKRKEIIENEWTITKPQSEKEKE